MLSLTPNSAWDEIFEVFGDGHDYDWALEGEEDEEYQEAAASKEMNYQDVCAIYLNNIDAVAHAT